MQERHEAQQQQSNITVNTDSNTVNASKKLSGGEIATTAGDQTGRQSAEPFFELRARVEDNPHTTLAHGCSGKIRFRLDPEPLLQQWIRQLRQLLQKRYQI